jgi:hypothetical protein
MRNPMKRRDSSWTRSFWWEVKTMGWILDFEKSKKDKEIIESFLDSHQDKNKLDEWKKQHSDLETEKKGTFRF